MRYALPLLVLALLGACGGGEERVLTTKEYADAMEHAFATLQEDSEKLAEDSEQALEDWFEEVGDRLASADSGESWSEEDGKLVSELAETLTRALTDSSKALSAFSMTTATNSHACDPPPTWPTSTAR